MKALICALLATSAFAQLPNHQLTPGKVRTTSTAEVCTRRARAFRKTTYAMKKQVCRAYGVEHCPSNGIMEIDHLVPLELGGADDVRNLWPEFASYASGGPGFHIKDQLENQLHREVCAGRMPLAFAQSRIAGNWIKLYKSLPHTP